MFRNSYHENLILKSDEQCVKTVFPSVKGGGRFHQIDDLIKFAGDGDRSEPSKKGEGDFQILQRQQDRV